MLCGVFFPGPGGDWYQETRLDTTLAIVNHGTLSIDSYHRDTQDKTFYDGHYYSITAPGLSLAAVPSTWLIERAFGTAGLKSVGRSGHTSYQFFMLRYLETLITVTLPGAALLVLMFWFLAFLTDSLWTRTAVALALGFATNVFAYGQVFFAHTPAALLVFVGFAFIALLANPRWTAPHLPGFIRTHPRTSAGLAGLFLGVAILFEYQTAVAVVLIGTYALWKIPRLLPLIVLSAVPPVLGVLLCNWVAYHNAFTTGYAGHSVVYGHQYASGLAGLAWPPAPAALWGLSFSPYRGLLFLCPFLLLSVPGYVLWLRRQAPEALVSMALPAGYFVMICMYPVWSAGHSVGPRFLIPSLPFLCLPLAYVLDRYPRVRPIFLMLIAAACLNVWIQTLAGVGYPAPQFANPLLDYSVPALEHGTIRASLGSLFTAPLGQAHSPTSLFPLVVLLAGWTAWVLRPGVWKPTTGTYGAVPGSAVRRTPR